METKALSTLRRRNLKMQQWERGNKKKENSEYVGACLGNCLPRGVSKSGEFESEE